MSGPERLVHHGGPAARLLASARLDAPSPRSRQRALAAAAGAASTLAAAGGSAALSGGAMIKSAAIWLCVGALGGTALGGATAYWGSPEPLPRAPVAVTSSAPLPEARVESASPVAPPEPAVEEPALAEQPPPRPSPELTGPRKAPAGPSSEPAPPVASSPVASFADSGVSQGLFEELKWLESARGAAGRGDYVSVLSTLEAYERSYPAGHFRPESMALRVEALSRLGRREEALSLADRFRRSYPAHPLLARVRAALGE